MNEQHWTKSSPSWTLFRWLLILCKTHRGGPETKDLSQHILFTGRQLRMGFLLFLACLGLDSGAKWKSQRRLYLGQCCVCVGRVSAKLCKWSISVMDPLDSNHGFESIILFLSQLRDNQQPKYSWQIFAFKSVSRLKSWAQQIHGRQNLLALPRD